MKPQKAEKPYRGCEICEQKMRADERAKTEKKFRFELKQLDEWHIANTKLQLANERAKTLKEVITETNKAGYFDGSEFDIGPFVLWLEAELKKLEGKT